MSGTRLDIDLPALGGRVAALQWQEPAAHAGPGLAFFHATGLTASSYRQALAPLGLQVPVLAIDQRGHGRTGLPTDPRTLWDWHLYAADAEAVLASRPAPAGGWLLAGHSMGAVVAVLLAARGKLPVAGLALIEPVATPDLGKQIYRVPFLRPLARRLPIARKAAARRAQFPSREAARRAYAGKAFFARWADGVLDDYLADGLTDDGAGAVRLSCEPAWEAATFAAQGHAFMPAFGKAVRASDGMVSVLYAETGSTTLPAMRRWMARHGAEARELSGSGHLLPQENPAAATQFLAECLAPFTQ